MNFANLRKKAKEETPKTLGLSKEECTVLLTLVAESNIKIKDIQYFYDLIYKIQEFIQEDNG
tara:strand:- start:188 stop:373 length:186 start_codon:yes stop_codon:yes gene_type:complete